MGTARSQRGKRRSMTVSQAARPVGSSLQPIEVLSEDQVESIHNASLKVVSDTGIEIMSAAARADVDPANERVRLARDLIEVSIHEERGAYVAKRKEEPA